MIICRISCLGLRTTKTPLRGAIRDFALFRGRVPGAFARGLERALAAKHGIELRGDDAEAESDGAAEQDIDDDFDDDEDA